MTVAIVALAIALTAVASLLGWQIYRADSRADQLVEERTAHSATTLRADKATFERDAFKEQLDDANAAIDVLAKEPDEKPNADLDPRDRDARAVRAAIKAKAAAARRANPTGAGEAATVHSEGAADASGAAAVPAAGSLDPNEVLR